jgi:Flp pilus assembly protein TadG
VQNISPHSSKRKPWSRLLVGARRVAGDQRGVTAIEFALVAPIFFFLIFVIFETAIIFVAEQVMDNAVFESARLIRTGQAQNGPGADPSAAPMTKAEFKANLCGRLAVLIDCNTPDFYLDVRSYPTFATMELGEPVNGDETFKDEGEYAFGRANDVVVVRAYYQWPAINLPGGLSMKNMENGKRLIGSFAAFRNEPF